MLLFFRDLFHALCQRRGASKPPGILKTRRISLEKRQGTVFKKALLSVTGLVVLFLILVLVNILVSYANVRWDATEDKSYSLSKGTRAILGAMSQPVTVKFFYSQSNPDIPPTSSSMPGA